MPRLIDAETDEKIDLRDLVETLETRHFDPEDEECLVEFGPALRRLSNNRAFLGDLIIEELKQRCAGQVGMNQYSAQVILLHMGNDYVLRANFWPAASDSVVVNSGTEPFFYGYPHDHNFNFLTVGHVGPGYWSDYYEYDYESTIGCLDEEVGLRFVERSRLSEGKVMLYRRHRDVHSQLPADSLSVSLNILAISRAGDFRDQYGFDLGSNRISAHVNRTTIEPLIALAGHIGGENGRDLVDEVARSHPSDRIRFAGWRAKAKAAGGPDERIAVYEAAAASAAKGSLLRGMAEREARRIRGARTHYDRCPFEALLSAA